MGYIVLAIILAMVVGSLFIFKTIIVAGVILLIKLIFLAVTGTLVLLALTHHEG